MAAKRASRRARTITFRLTRGGWLFLVLSFLLGATAGGYPFRSYSGPPLTFVVFGGMMGAILVSGILARRIIAAVVVRRHVPSRVWQNQTVHLGYVLKNLRRRHCLDLHIDEQAPEGIEGAAGYCVYLPPRSAFRAGGRFLARRRGRVKLDRIRLSTRFPFSLLTAGKEHSDPASLVIWPARGKLKAQLLCRGAVESSSAAPSPAMGGQDEFFGLREYRPDDNPRWIHWRRSAARKTPVVREMSKPLPEILWVILDTCGEDLSESAMFQREKMLRFAATLIEHALVRGYKVGLLLAYAAGRAVHHPSAGRAHRNKLLDALADVDVNREHSLADVLAGESPGQFSQSQVIMILPDAARINSGVRTAVRAACRHLTVIDEKNIDRVFEDDALSESQEAPAAEESACH